MGVLTLLTDLWRAQEWLFPQGNILTPATWQGILGGLFLLTFLAWVWFAFIRPPIYGRMNAERYGTILYRIILEGSPSELAVIADELTRSVKSLIRHATDLGKFESLQVHDADENKPQRNPPKVTEHADFILQLISDKRFCRATVDSSPGTALAVFHEMAKTNKHGVQVEIFAKNILNEALVNRNSFLFHEAEGYESGLMGYHKPVSQAMFSNYRMVETIGTLLDLDVLGRRKLDSAQWEAYCRVVLITFRDYVETGFWSHSFVLHQAMRYIRSAASDLYKINGVTNSGWNDDIQDRLRVVVEFINDAVEILDKKGVPYHLQLRVREKDHKTFYDHLASMIFEVIFSASAVRSPAGLCWHIQHNAVWESLFNFYRLDGAAGKIVKFKVRRLIYDEVTLMKSIPNFKGARIIGFCLNVMGLTVREGDYNQDSKALKKAVLSWTKKNYAGLHSCNPYMAEKCLVDGMAYDEENLKLVKTYDPLKGLRREPNYVYFNVDPPPGNDGQSGNAETRK